MLGQKKKPLIHQVFLDAQGLFFYRCFGGDGEILNLLASLGASRPVGVSNRPFLRLAETSSGSPSAPIKKTPTSGVFFIGGDGGMPFMYTTVSPLGCQYYSTVFRVCQQRNMLRKQIIMLFHVFNGSWLTACLLRDISENASQTVQNNQKHQYSCFYLLFRKYFFKTGILNLTFEQNGGIMVSDWR